LREIDWYVRHRKRARVAYQVNELLILLVTAATTVAAALKATAWVTASLAASAVVLTGLHKIFDWHDQWVGYGSAWAELQVAVHDYRLIPDGERDEQARRRLVGKVDEVITADTGRWAARRRSLSERRT
jgi:hypothetical protein